MSVPVGIWISLNVLQISRRQTIFAGPSTSSRLCSIVFWTV